MTKLFLNDRDFLILFWSCGQDLLSCFMYNNTITYNAFRSRLSRLVDIAIHLKILTVNILMVTSKQSSLLVDDDLRWPQMIFLAANETK